MKQGDKYKNKETKEKVVIFSVTRHTVTFQKENGELEKVAILSFLKAYKKTLETLLGQIFN